MQFAVQLRPAQPDFPSKGCSYKMRIIHALFEFGQRRCSKASSLAVTILSQCHGKVEKTRRGKLPATLQKPTKGVHLRGRVRPSHRTTQTGSVGSRPQSPNCKLAAKEAKICSMAAISTRIDAGFGSTLKISGLFHSGRKKSRRHAKPQRLPNDSLPAIMKDKTRTLSLGSLRHRGCFCLLWFRLVRAGLVEMKNARLISICAHCLADESLSRFSVA